VLSNFDRRAKEIVCPNYWENIDDFSRFFYGDNEEFKDYIINCGERYFNEVELELSKPLLKKNLVLELKLYFHNMEQDIKDMKEEILTKLGCPCCNIILENIEPEQETLFYNFHTIMMLKELNTKPTEPFIICLGLCKLKS